MLSRFLLTLAIAWQPLALWASPAPIGPTAECAAVSCCEVIERVSCCGDRVVEHVCGKTGGQCLCGMAPGDSPERGPEAPTPRSERISLVAVPAPLFRIVAVVDAEASPRLLRAIDLSLLSGRNHNEVQALLGVWRT